jgi:Carboxypeptidase regulatory-like domain
MSSTVTDTSGGIVPSGTISVKNIGAGITHSTLTNGAELYTVLNLQSGSYELTASADGFNTGVRTREVYPNESHGADI